MLNISLFIQVYFIQNTKHRVKIVIARIVRRNNSYLDQTEIYTLKHSNLENSFKHSK